MDYTLFIDFNSLTDEARKELESYYEYLVFKYKRKNKRKADEERNQLPSSYNQADYESKGF